MAGFIAFGFSLIVLSFGIVNYPSPSKIMTALKNEIAVINIFGGVGSP